MLSYYMASISHKQEVLMVLLDKVLSLDIWMVFMSLHSQKYHVIGLGSLVHGNSIKRLAKQLLILLVAGYNKGVVNLLEVSVIIKVFNHFAIIHGLRSIEYLSCPEIRDDWDDEEEGRLETQVQAHIDTNFLIELRDEERPEEHECPTDKVEKGYYELVFVVMWEIWDVHPQ